MRTMFAISGVLLACGAAWGQVFINEVYINPPGSSADDTREYIELLGTPNRKLDGYALAFVNGGLARYFAPGSVPPRPEDQEIDEFFSLDGLALGQNGLLVIGIGNANFYPTLLPDTAFVQWGGLWNGGLDTPGKLNNDGSNTILLLRNRPGATQADPANPDGLRWGKDVNCDDELISDVIDPQTGLPADQYGDGELDRGDALNPDGIVTLDCVGALTPELLDDLEIVDEISYEHERGWELDTDQRQVDAGSLHGGLPPRRVHTLDDPQGLNPDALTRVDYRTEGPGWTPAPGAVGELPNGNNWQDTATEQWIRGESVVGTGGEGNPPQFFYSVAPNDNPDAVQPFTVHVPGWLADGVAPDFDFGSVNYQLMAGRLNPLAVPFIPGDVDRDGDCDADDIAKIAAVFGDTDWVFANAWAGAVEGNDGDPATQIRPWDVDASGDNGIDPTDLQWTLNFQNDQTGRIVGVRYDSTNPSAVGVHLNPNAGTHATLSTSVHVPSGRPLSGLRVGDTVLVTVRGALTAGANTTAGQRNGLMQFMHDVTVSPAGVLRVTATSLTAPFDPTRAELIEPLGQAGDAGVATLHGTPRASHRAWRDRRSCTPSSSRRSAPARRRSSQRRPPRSRRPPRTA